MKIFFSDDLYTMPPTHSCYTEKTSDCISFNNDNDHDNEVDDEQITKN